MSGLRTAAKRHCIWLIILTCFTLGWWVDVWIKDKRQNYKEHWRIQAEHEQRIKALEAQ